MPAVNAEFICFLHAARPTMLTDGPTQAESDLVRRHFSYFEDLVQQGVMILAGRPWMPDPRTFGVAIVRAANQAAAEAMIEADPAVRENVIQADVYPFEVMLQPSSRATA